MRPPCWAWPPPPEIAFEAAEFTPMQRSFYADNKRVSNAAIKQALGIDLLYPTYREGLADILSTGKQHDHAAACQIGAGEESSWRGAMYGSSRWRPRMRPISTRSQACRGDRSASAGCSATRQRPLPSRRRGSPRRPGTRDRYVAVIDKASGRAVGQ